MYAVLDGAPRYRDTSVVTPAMAPTCPLLHPAVGTPVWKMTNPAAGAIAGNVFTPTVGWFGLCHIVGKVQNVRALCSVRIVPNAIPRFTLNRSFMRIGESQHAIQGSSVFARPRPGAEDWTLEVAKTVNHWVPGDWSAPLEQVMAVNRVGNVIDGAIANAPVGSPHRWLVLEWRGLNDWVDRTADCVPTGPVNGPSAGFTLPEPATDSWTLLAIDQWDCWVVGEYLT